MDIQQHIRNASPHDWGPPATFSYDANGNLTSDGSNSYVYDAENRLVSASGAHTATLSYDPLGRLWQVTAPSGTTRFVYDGDHIAIEYDSAGTLLRAYVHGAGADEPLIWYEVATGGALRRYFHADHQGSIVAVSDQSGNALAVTGYDAWGIPNAGGLGFGAGGVGRDRATLRRGAIRRNRRARAVLRV